MRVRWSAKIWARDPALGLHSFGGEPALFHLDGISAYDLDAKGMVKAHRLENIVMTGREHEQQTVANLAFAWPVPGMATPELAIPFFKLMSSKMKTSAGAALRKAAPKGPGGGRSGGPVFMMATDGASASTIPTEKEKKMAAVAEATAAAWREQRKAAGIEEEEDRSGPFSNLFGGMQKGLPQACESSWDCDSPMVCCDLLVASVCCDGGLFIPVRQDPMTQGSMVPIPIPVEPDEPFPGAGAGGSGGYPGDRSGPYSF